MKNILLLSILLICGFSAFSQRRITPVEKSNNSVAIVDAKTREKMLKQYALKDSVAQDSLRQDSIAKAKVKFPILTDVTFGVDFWQPLMRLFGSKYGGFGISATLNMWNRLQPALEIGFGLADNTPEGKNFRYKSPLAIYTRLGANYNILFKKETDYQVLAGFRIGYSSYKYNIYATQKDGYWGTSSEFDILNQKGSAVWAEILLGLKVKIVGPLSAGWFFKYQTAFKIKDGPNGNAWYIPGFGTRKSSISANLSIYYTLPLMKSRLPKKDDPLKEEDKEKSSVKNNE